MVKVSLSDFAVSRSSISRFEKKKRLRRISEQVRRIFVRARISLIYVQYVRTGFNLLKYKSIS